MRCTIILALLLWQTPQVLSQAAQPSAAERLAQVQQKLKQFDPSMIAELLEVADKDPDPAIRQAILVRLSRLNHSAVREALERHAASDPDAQVAMAILERLRLQQAQDLGVLFEKRQALAKMQNDAAGLQALAGQHQKWATLARGALLPSFLQTAPPVIEAMPSKASVRVLAIGDFGQPGPDQRKVAAAALAYHRKTAVDLGATLGDNFVADGVTGLADPRWMREWEELYGPLNIPFFAATGNHDWGFADSPAAEILYSKQSQNWRMPALYYSYVAGPVQFFVVATQAWSETQAQWLEQELGRSTARWKGSMAIMASTPTARTETPPN
jgi:tartrate-resistant acid phosphatase type 5